MDSLTDLSFSDKITDWDNFIPTPEMNDSFIRVLEEDIHPFLQNLDNENAPEDIHPFLQNLDNENAPGTPPVLQKENIPPINLQIENAPLPDLEENLRKERQSEEEIS